MCSSPAPRRNKNVIVTGGIDEKICEMSFPRAESSPMNVLLGRVDEEPGINGRTMEGKGRDDKGGTGRETKNRTVDRDLTTLV